LRQSRANGFRSIPLEVMRMSSFKRRLCLAVLFCVSIASCLGQTGETLLCTKDRINGFDNQYDEAIRYIGHSTTSDPEQMQTFVAVKGKYLYMQSNYKAPGADNPAKLSSDEDLPAGVSSALLNYLVSHDLSRSEDFKHSSVFIDSSALTSPYFEVFNDAENVQVIGSDGDVYKTATVSKLSGSPERVIIGSDDLYYEPNSFAQERQLNHLRSRKFDQTSVSVLSLVNNSETRQAVTSSIPSSNRIILDSTNPTQDDVINAIQAKRNKTIVVLGHIEGSSFVTYSTDGTAVLLSMPVDKLMSAAESENVQLFLLGCDSASSSDAGVIGTFNTVDAVTRLGTALRASTVGQFFAAMSPEGSHLVLRTDDLTGVGIDVHDDKGAYVGRIILPRAVWIASGQSTILEDIGDIIGAIWHWIWNLVVKHWIWVVIVVFVVIRVALSS
jgi:hypothetical protein